MTSRRPQYEEIAALLRRRIEAGEFDNGEPFPSATALANDIGVSRPTVASALAALEGLGLLRLGRGRPPIVVPPDARQPSTGAGIREGEVAWEATGRYARARAAQGLIFGGHHTGEIEKRTLDREWMVPDPEMIELLQTGPAAILRRRSLTRLNGSPTEFTAMHFPPTVVEAVPAFDQPADILVVKMIEAAGWTIVRTHNRVRSRPSTPAEAEILDLPPSSSVFEWTHVTLGQRKRGNPEPVEGVRNIKPTDGTVLAFDTNEAPLDH